MVDDLAEYAANFPEMGGASIGPWLTEYAADTSSDIVEIGTWLGAGTAHLALGARQSGARIHTFDRFEATDETVRKATPYGLNFALRDNTLPHVRAQLKPFGADIVFHKADLFDATWSGAPIGVYVDDAAKGPQLWAHVMRTFAPSWVDGCLVVLMDYYYYRKWERQGVKSKARKFRRQREFVEARPRQFEQIADQLAGRSNAVFRYHKRRWWHVGWDEPDVDDV